jgi:hypothetical protein
MQIEWVIVGVLALSTIGLTILLERATYRLTKTNEKLMVMLSSRDGDVAGTRSLVAMSNPPQGKLPGVATGSNNTDQKSTLNTGTVVTYGVME